MRRATGRNRGVARTVTWRSALAAGGLVMAAVVLCAVAPEGLAAQNDDRERPPPGANLGFDPSPWQRYNTPYSGKFTFVRLMFQTRGGGRFMRNPPWAHDYPVAETNFGQILSALTEIEPWLGGGNVLAMDDPELFRYPVAYISEPGFWSMSAREVETLRAYLQKGGFLILDDFAGPGQWSNTIRQLSILLPENRIQEIDQTHPIFDAFFRIDDIYMPHPNFGFTASYYAIFEDDDPSKRMLVMINRDNDIGDYWEWSNSGFVPIELSNEAYKLGVNYVIYALTH